MRTKSGTKPMRTADELTRRCLEVKSCDELLGIVHSSYKINMFFVYNHPDGLMDDFLIRVTKTPRKPGRVRYIVMDLGNNCEVVAQGNFQHIRQFLEVDGETKIALDYRYPIIYGKPGKYEYFGLISRSNLVPCKIFVLDEVLIDRYTLNRVIGQLDDLLYQVVDVDGFDKLVKPDTHTYGLCQTTSGIWETDTGYADALWDESKRIINSDTY